MSVDPEEVIRRDLEFCIEATRRAGRRAIALRKSERWQDATLADIGDNAVDGYLQGLIQGRYPEDGILSEETKDTARRIDRARTWIVDPLDGTREYSQQRDDWAVHLALTIDGACAVAAVGLPAKDLVLWGVALPGAERAGVVASDGPSDRKLFDGATSGAMPPRIACSRSHTPSWMEAFCEELHGGELVRAGSAGNKVGLCVLGEADVYVHRTGLKEWDTCAPETIARSLGWTVCRLRGEEHAYNQSAPRNDELVVCRPAWRERVLAAIAKCGALDPPKKKADAH